MTNPSTLADDANYHARRFFDTQGKLHPHVIDLGSGHYAKPYMSATWTDASTTALAGWQLLHPKGNNAATGAYAGSPWCLGSVAFDLPETAAARGPKWTVEQMEPLTISPSVACDCGDHGFIREGRWVSA